MRARMEAAMLERRIRKVERIRSPAHRTKRGQLGAMNYSNWHAGTR